VQDRHGKVPTAVLELKYKRIRVLPPLYNQARYPGLDLTVLHAVERGKPRGRDRIEWKLITNLPIASRAQAVEKLQWYALRWRIETFHKILKCLSTPLTTRPNSPHAWWRHEGCHRYAHADRIGILANSGGSNSPTCRAWKYHLHHQLAQRFGCSSRSLTIPPAPEVESDQASALQ
jgi:hypothetical protein